VYAETTMKGRRAPTLLEKSAAMERIMIDARGVRVVAACMLAIKHTLATGSQLAATQPLLLDTAAATAAADPALVAGEVMAMAWATKAPA
jgi:hypothetical protein